METSVPPPPSPPPAAEDEQDGEAAGSRGLFATGPPRPGALTGGWRVILLVAWVLVILAYCGVWKASRELGLATWWLGPSAAPRPLPVMLLPFIAPVVMIVATLNNSHRLVTYGVVAGGLGLLIGLADLAGVHRFGLVELAIGVAGIAVALASVAGRYQRAPAGT